MPVANVESQVILSALFHRHPERPYAVIPSALSRHPER